MRRRRQRHIAKFALVVTEPFEDPLLQRRLESLVVQTRLSTELFELGDSELLDARAALFVCIVRKWVGTARLFRSLDHHEGVRRMDLLDSKDLTTFQRSQRNSRDGRAVSVASTSRLNLLDKRGTSESGRA